MASLGSFGRKYEPLDLDFEFFGETFRVNPQTSQLDLIDFLAQAGQVDEADEVKGAQLIVRTMQEVVHPDDWERFWSIAKRERQDPQNDLMPIAQAVLEAATGFPTGPASGSTAGQSSTPPRFEVELPSPASPVLDPLTLKGIQLTQGRPDLQVAMLRAGAARNGAPVPN